MIQGILFDMDGILFDTECLCMRVSQQLFTDMGRCMTDEMYRQLIGRTIRFADRRIKEFFGEDFDLDYYNSQLFARLNHHFEQHGIPEKDGVGPLLQYLSAQGLKTAVASSNSIDIVRQYLDTSGLAPYFDAVIGGDMVKEGKPAPDVYLAAAQALGLPPNCCLAVEDSHNGILSASAAGCITVMIPDLLPPTEELRPLCAAVLEQLSDIPVFLAAHNGTAAL